MWCWAIIEEKTDRVIEEGYMMRKDAEREAQKMGGRVYRGTDPDVKSRKGSFLFFLIFFKKGIDFCAGLCYNTIRKRKGSAQDDELVQ